VAKNAPTCHEQIIKHEREQFFVKDRGKGFGLERWKEGGGREKEGTGEKEKGVREKFLKESYLTNKMQAEVVMNGFHRFNVKGDNEVREILLCARVWNFRPECFDILRVFGERRTNDPVFAKRIEWLEHEAEFLLVPYGERIRELRALWKDYKPELCL